MQNVFLNIILNAIWAISTYKKSKKIIEVDVKFNEVGDFIITTIKDGGRGIKKGAEEKIFDPFFTTKDRDGGEGTGLGLAISKYGIGHIHQGKIKLMPSPKGWGAVFEVRLRYDDKAKET